MEEREFDVELTRPFLPLPFSFVDASFTGRDLRSTIHVSSYLSPFFRPRFQVSLVKWQELLPLRTIKLTPFPSPSRCSLLLQLRSSLPHRLPRGRMGRRRSVQVSLHLPFSSQLPSSRPQPRLRRASQDHLELTSLSSPPPSSFNQSSRSSSLLLKRSHLRFDPRERMVS